MIDIIKFLIEKAKADGLSPFQKFVKTLDNTKMILSQDYDSDDFDEQKAYGNREEKIVVDKSNGPQKNKKKQWKNQGPKEESK